MPRAASGPRQEWSPLKVRPRPSYSRHLDDCGPINNDELPGTLRSPSAYPQAIRNGHHNQLVYDARPGTFVHCRDLHEGAATNIVAVRDLDYLWTQGQSQGRAMCLKTFRKADIINDNELRSRVEREIEAHRLLDSKRNLKAHAFILRLEASLVDESYLYLATNLMRCNLLVELKNRPVEKEKIRKWIAQIDLGLTFIHHGKIVHGSIRPENILIDFEDNIKITDFGSCRQDGFPAIGANNLPKWPYLAPESHDVTPGAACTKANDYWGVGVLVLGLESERARFIFEDGQGENFGQWYETGYPNFPDLDCHALSLVRGLLDRRPQHRFGHQQLVKHAYFSVRSGPSRNNCYEKMWTRKLAGDVLVPLERSDDSRATTYRPTPKVEDHQDCDFRFESLCWVNERGVWGKGVQGEGKTLWRDDS